MAWAIVCVLSSVPKPDYWSVKADATENERIVLVGHEDLEPADYLGQRNRPVLAPVLYRLNVIDHDNEVLLFALVVDLGLRAVSTRHLER